MVKLIPYRGAWLRYEYDVRSSSYQVRMDSPRRVLKIPMIDFLKALGFVIDRDRGEIYLAEEMWEAYGLNPAMWPDAGMRIEDGLDGSLQRDTTVGMRDAQIEIWRKLHPTDPYSDEVLANMLPSRFFDPKRYDLARVGRYMLNKKLGVHVPIETTTLTVIDMLEAFKHLFYLQEHGRGLLDDIDHLNLENRRVEHVGEQLVSQLRKGLLRVERIVRERMMLPEAEKESPKTLINTRPIIGVIKEFFGSSQMSQFMDNTNPLTSLTHKRRFSALGPKGLTREAARFDFRDVHHSHYGRICPIESPEGPNIGLISSLSAFAQVNEYGFIETPYFKVTDSRVSDEVVYLSADQELEDAIAPSTTQRDEEGNITEPVLFVRRRGNFEQVAREEVSYVEVAPNQFISVTTSLIPFLEHDDANRALMGSNMQRQAVPLLFPESPIVGTGIERKLAEDAGGLEISPFCGEVTYVDSRRITLRKGVVYDKESGEIMDLPNLEKIEGEEVLNRSKFDYMFTPAHAQQELYRKLEFDARAFRKLRKSNEHTETIWLRKFQRSNQGTLINQRIVVRKGYPVIKGDLLADSSSTDLGEMALGRNVLVSFMSWRGYNFEDAILCSEKLLKRNLFTSIHIEKHECEARQTKLGPEKITREITGLQEEYIERNLDDKGIIRVGAEVKSGDVLVGKITPKGESDLTGEEKLIRAVFGDKGKGFKNTPLKVPHGEDGVIIATSYFNREKGDELAHNVVEMARVYTVKRRTLQVGDKMAGRHGNKGVVSIVLPEEDMPFLPDGTPLDIILNPLGVPSRMNIGQVLETHLGLACSMIDIEDEDTIDELYEMEAPHTYDKHRRDLSGAGEFMHFARKNNPLKVECPVFLSPSEDKIREIFRRLSIPLDGKTMLYDGITGEPFKERVMVGVMYMMKLNHLVDDKIHARSTGSYALITQQPLGGKAQFGGQRLGEMEVWALEGYGAAYLLKEMLTVKSDDVVGRNNTYKAIVDGRIIPEPGIPESFYVMVNELKSLGLDVSVIYKGDELRRSILDEEQRPLTVRGDDIFDH
jgi:DNA-directed RNA polymerase subunit beta